jgi:hypothetical protein
LFSLGYRTASVVPWQARRWELESRAANPIDGPGVNDGLGGAVWALRGTTMVATTTLIAMNMYILAWRSNTFSLSLIIPYYPLNYLLLSPYYPLNYLLLSPYYPLNYPPIIPYYPLSYPLIIPLLFP